MTMPNQKVTLLSPEPRQSTRISKPVVQYKPSMAKKDYNANNFVTQVLDNATYDAEIALMMAKTIFKFRDRSTNAIAGMSFAKTYSLKAGIRVLGERGEKAAFDEVNQLHQRGCFDPVDVTSLSQEERDKVLESLIFLTQKRDGMAKAQTCVNGSKQQLWTDKEDSASPTVLLESVMITSVIDAKEGCEVAVIDIPECICPNRDGRRTCDHENAREVGRTTCRGCTGSVRDYVVTERGQTVLYLELRKALYGMLQSALLFYKKLRRDLEKVGFVVNPYDPCVANKVVDGSQMTVVWHVDDLKILHVKKKCVDNFIDWAKSMYEDKVGKVKASCGKQHDYLGMEMDFLQPGSVRVKMERYVREMVATFPDQSEVQKEVVSPAADNLFQVREEKLLESERADVFHTIVAKGLFVAKRARPDIMMTIAFLCTQV